MDPPFTVETAPAAWEPPGGLLVWIVVFLELVTFGAGFGVFMAQQREHAAVFAQGREMLDQSLALANTLILLTGGWCMANAIAALRRARERSAFIWINAAIFSGLGFLILKGFEYAGKIRHGIGFGEDAFFTLYYALTGFHAVHVLVAVVLLAFMALGIRRGRYTAHSHLDVESSGIFWHLCDLIWAAFPHSLPPLMKANTIAWIILVLLTVASFCVSESDTAHKAAAVILAAAGLKFALVGWQFMDLRRSMAAWSLALFMLLGLILGVVLILQ